jgi:hypothetical protein
MSMDTWCIVLMEGRLLGTCKRSVHLSGQGRLLDRPLRGRHAQRGADYWTDLFAVGMHNEIRVPCPDRSMPRLTLLTQKVCPVIAPLHRSWTDNLSDLTDLTKRSVRLSPRKGLSDCRHEKVCPIVAIIEHAHAMHRFDERSPRSYTAAKGLAICRHDCRHSIRRVSRKGLSDCRHYRTRTCDASF